MDIGNSPRKGQPPRPEEKNFKGAKPRILILISGPMLRKTTIQTDRCSPAFTAVLLKIAKTQTQERVQRQMKSWKNVYNLLSLRHQNPPLKLWNYATGHHKDGPWRILRSMESATEEDYSKWHPFKAKLRKEVHGSNLQQKKTLTFKHKQFLKRGEGK